LNLKKKRKKKGVNSYERKGKDDSIKAKGDRQKGKNSCLTKKPDGKGKLVINGEKKRKKNGLRAQKGKKKGKWSTANPKGGKEADLFKKGGDESKEEKKTWTRWKDADPGSRQV